MKIRVVAVPVSILILLVIAIKILPAIMTPPMVKELAALTEGINPPEGDYLQNVVYRNQILRKDFDLDIYYPLSPAKDLFTSYHSDLWT